jgi:hypothetical protein
LLVVVQVVVRRLVDDVIELETFGNDFTLRRHQRDQVIDIREKRRHVPDTLQVCPADRALQ